MPRKARFTKEDFINTAFAIARESGLSAITARELASRLECSTRPMFTCFDSVDELREEVAKKASESFYSALRADGGDPLTALGLSILGFAKSEPGLWSVRKSAGLDLGGFTGTIADAYSLTDEQAAHALSVTAGFCLCEPTELMLRQVIFAELKALREVSGYLKGEFTKPRQRQFASWID